MRTKSNVVRKSNEALKMEKAKQRRDDRIADKNERMLASALRSAMKAIDHAHWSTHQIVTRLLSTTQAAAALGLDRSRIKVLCARGRIRGAHKIGNQWAIPAPPTILPPTAPHRTAPTPPQT